MTADNPTICDIAGGHRRRYSRLPELERVHFWTLWASNYTK